MGRHFNVNGIKLYYEDFGDPEAKETVAFFNGVMASVSSWEFIYPVFVKLGYRVILHDFKGQLRSDKPDGEYSFAGHAEEARALFEFLGVKKLHIIGTSYGGEIAMKFAVLFPDMTKTISLIDSASETNEVMIGFVDSWKNLCDTGDSALFFTGMAPTIYGPRYMHEQSEQLAARAKALKSISPDFFAGQKILYDTFKKDTHLTAELKKISCPALVLCGEDDILKPPEFSKIISDNIPDSEFLLIPGCGHVAIYEKPKELTSAILGFISKHA